MLLRGLVSGGTKSSCFNKAHLPDPARRNTNDSNKDYVSQDRLIKSLVPALKAARDDRNFAQDGWIPVFTGVKLLHTIS